MNPNSSRTSRCATCSSGTSSPDGVDNIRDSFINIAQPDEQAAGTWRRCGARPLPWGELSIETQHTFQDEDVLAFFADQRPEDLNGQLGDPEWVGHLNLTFDRGPWSFFWGVQFIGSNLEPAALPGSRLARIRAPTAGWSTTSFWKRMRSFTTPLSVKREFEDHGPEGAARRLQPVRRGAAKAVDHRRHQRAKTQPSAIRRSTRSTTGSGRNFYLNLTKTF